YDLYADLSLSNWEPIGDLVADVSAHSSSVSMQGASKAFTGVFRGNNKTISFHGFGTGAAAKRGGGIFACTDGARIENLTVHYYAGAFDITGLAVRVSGGVAGYARNSELVNLRVSGTIEVNQTGFFGGIAGYNGNDHTGTGTALIDNCVCDADIQIIKSGAVLYAGSIAGMNDSGVGTSTIRNSHSTGDMDASGSGSIYMGGIVGDNGRYVVNNGARRIVNCSSSGAISINTSGGEAIAGGIAGNSRKNGGTGISSIENCYSSGPVSAANTGTSNVFAGGIVGYNQNSRVTNCYATGSVSGSSGSGAAYLLSGGIAGLSTYGSLVQNCYAAGAVSVSGSATTCYAGGITASGTNPGDTVSNNAAINQIVSSPGSHRITASPVPTTLTNNIAWDGMVLNGGSVTDATANGADGASKTKAELETSGTWTSLFSGFGANWKWIAGYLYPVLSWQTSAPAAWTPLP
ncbi:MAG: hypothetical protein LBI90_02050, partial [Treponema sp.]|nr:hypothetical protein [Treponema sp.]